MRRRSKRPEGRRSARAITAVDEHVGWLAISDQYGDPLVAAPPPVTERLRYVVERLLLQDPDGLPSRIGVTSAMGGEGVPLIARTLAGVLAGNADRTVCVVSLDWWTGPVADGRGIAHVATGETDVDRALLRTSQPRLLYLPAGRTSSAGLPGLVRSAGLATTLREVSLRFHHVVLELPPIRVTSEALALAGHCDACVVVALHGVTSRNDLEDVVDSLGDDRILGVLLNQASSKVPDFLLRAVAPA